MKKIIRLIMILSIFYLLFTFGNLLKDHVQLKNKILRLHVVANSDSSMDQTIKLQVRDAVLTYLEPVMNGTEDKESAMQYINTHVQQLEKVANTVLTKSGSTDSATVSLKRECFGRRDYDTFSLPAGIYDSLRITIGSGSGKNWWCVVFPAFCVDAASVSLQDTAVTAGISESLVDTIQLNRRYEIRFFLLDCLGRLENFFTKA